MSERFISEEMRLRLRELPIREVAELVGAQPVRKRFICYGGHDKNPSLHVNEQKGLYHCFGCGQGGDVIALVMNAEKLDYPAACHWLMSQYRLSEGHVGKVPYHKSKPTARPKSKAPEPHPENYVIYEWLISHLRLSDRGIDYLVKKRGFGREQIQDLEIRDIPLPMQTRKQLQAKFSEAELLTAGLMKKDDKGLSFVWWDYVIVFPYLDENLRIVNLQGRRLMSSEPKYVFLRGISPTLYNLNILNELQRGDRLLLCEGVPDTISALELGHKAVGVPGAHNFKPEFVSLLMDYDIYVVPDRDKGGQDFLNNVKTAFKTRGKTIREFQVPDGNNDLNDYLIRKNSGLQ